MSLDDFRSIQSVKRHSLHASSLGKDQEDQEDQDWQSGGGGGVRGHALEFKGSQSQFNDNYSAKSKDSKAAGVRLMVERSSIALTKRQ